MSTNTSGSHRRVRVGTIVWGALLLGIAAVALVVMTTGPLSSAAALWVIVGFGALLVFAALAAAIVRAVRSRPGRSTVETEDQPIG